MPKKIEEKLKKEADKIFPGTILGEEGMRLSV